MTMNLSVDVVFHFDRFRTYDLLSQGSHRMKVQIWHQPESGEKIMAYPYFLPDKKYLKKNKDP